MDSGFVALHTRVCGCGDLQLVAELQRLARVDRRCEVRLLVYLAEVEARLLHLASGFSSMFTFARATLRMSEAQTYLRIQAARVAKTYPAVLEMLEEGALNLSTLKLLAPHLTTENHLALLERARDKSKREVELLVAVLEPLPDVPTRLRKLPARAARAQSSLALDANALNPRSALATATVATTMDASSMLPPAAPTQIDAFETIPAAVAADRRAPVAHAHVDVAASSSITDAGAPRSASSTAPQQASSVAWILQAPPRAPQTSESASPQLTAADSRSDAQQSDSNVLSSRGLQRARSAFAVPGPRASCKPLGAARFKLELTASQKVHDTLMQLQHLLRHQVPSGDLADIVERALDDLLSKTLKQRFAQTPKPRARPVKPSKAGEFRMRGHREVSARESGDAHGTDSGATAQTLVLAEAAGEEAKSFVRPEARGESRSRYIPRAVVRAVSERDGLQCTFVSSDGQRCSERGMLELHHVHAFAKGGASSVENLKWVCRGHNQLFALQDFGATHMHAMRFSAAERREREQLP